MVLAPFKLSLALMLNKEPAAAPPALPLPVVIAWLIGLAIFILYQRFAAEEKVASPSPVKRVNVPEMPHEVIAFLANKIAVSPKQPVRSPASAFMRTRTCDFPALDTLAGVKNGGCPPRTPPRSAIKNLSVDLKAAMHEEANETASPSASDTDTDNDSFSRQPSVELEEEIVRQALAVGCKSPDPRISQARWLEMNEQQRKAAVAWHANLTEEVYDSPRLMRRPQSAAPPAEHASLLASLVRAQ